MDELLNCWIFVMPPPDERTQCFEWAQEADKRIQDAILHAYRSQNVQMDLTFPGVREVVKWQTITVVSN